VGEEENCDDASQWGLIAGKKMTANVLIGTMAAQKEKKEEGKKMKKLIALVLT